MPNPSRIFRRLQLQENLIDFPVSDTFRDHYAAQHLTYSAGRAAPQTRPRLPVDPLGWTDDRPVALGREIDGLRAALAKERERAARLQSEVEALRTAVRRKAPPCTGVLEEWHAT